MGNLYNFRKYNFHSLIDRKNLHNNNLVVNTVAQNGTSTKYLRRHLLQHCQHDRQSESLIERTRW